LVNQIIIDLINNSIGIDSFTPEPELIKSRFDFSKYYVPYAANCAHPAALMEWHDFHGWLSFSVTQSAAAFMHILASWADLIFNDVIMRIYNVNVWLPTINVPQRSFFCEKMFNDNFTNDCYGANLYLLPVVGISVEWHCKYCR